MLYKCVRKYYSMYLISGRDKDTFMVLAQNTIWSSSTACGSQKGRRISNYWSVKGGWKNPTCIDPLLITRQFYRRKNYSLLALPEPDRTSGKTGHQTQHGLDQPYRYGDLSVNGNKVMEIKSNNVNKAAPACRSRRESSICNCFTIGDGGWQFD
jgi:hypothetical protein